MSSLGEKLENCNKTQEACFDFLPDWEKGEQWENIVFIH